MRKKKKIEESRVEAGSWEAMEIKIKIMMGR